MTVEEAKAILSVYRDDLADEALPEVQEALSLLDTDPDLLTWFEAEQRFDAEFSAALQGISIPPGLAEKILTEAPSSEDTPDTKTITFPTRRLWLAAAAAVVLTAAGLVKYFVFPPAVQFPGTEFASIEKFRDDMAFYANSRFVLGHMTKNLTEARDWLKAHQSPVYDETPGPIVSYEGMGCQTFAWGEHQVSLVCFKNGDGDVVHLFVANKAAFKDLLPAESLQALDVRQKLETGGWTTEDKVYLLVGSEPEVKIGSVLTSALGA